VAGYLIAVIAFAVPLLFGLTGFARARIVLGVGTVLGLGWFAAGAAQRASDVQAGHEVLPLWFFAGLVALLYVIWCGGFWLGIRLRRLR
jgi:hypothetical protein